jgi:hypothetical protein
MGACVRRLALQRQRRVRVIAVLVASLMATLAVPLISPAVGAGGGPCGPPVTSVIACENSQPGDPTSDWQVQGIGDAAIQGYATSMSVNVGQTESFKIKTPSTNYHIDILRLGYYGGTGARKIAASIKPSATLPQTQPACLTNSTTGLIDCGNWGVSSSWAVPSTAVSGMYVAHLVRDDASNPNGGSLIPFVVRNDSSHSDMLVSSSDSTWEAYNAYGGNSLYTCTVACPPGNPSGYKAAYAVSYNRPFDGSFTTDGGVSYLWYVEYQMVRWLERNGYDVSYTTSSDVDRAGSSLLNHKLFVSSGHDEYWSAGQRANVTAARDAGVNLAFFSGNEIFWKTRWANSSDGSNTPYRTLITYKETHFDAPTDPQDPTTWTGTWEDPRFSPPADGGNPPNSLSGQMFLVNTGTVDMQVPSTYSKLRFWRNTDVTKLTSGQSLTLSPGAGTLGYEWDQDADNGFRPAGLMDMSSTTSTVQIFKDYGTNVVNGPATHHLTLYRAPSGALVFGAGTVQWAWGLDNTNAWDQFNTDPSANPPDPNMEQATVNLFGDMGIQPTTLQTGLVQGTASTDATAPTSSVGSPAAGTNFQDGDKVTITGTAADGGGGVVAGVEVSTDGGSTWHPTTLTGAASTSVSWTSSWIAHGAPSTKIMSRAVDDSGNIEAPGAGNTINIACPCSIWGANSATDATDSADANSIEVGMKFTSDTFGTVSGLRFYKFPTNTGTHVGSLWTSTGQLLAQATFSGESSSGWQQVSFSNPVPINPNTTYVIAYFAPVGHYAQTENYFYPPPSPAPDWGSTVDSGPLHALRNTLNTTNDVYIYTGSQTFPTSTFDAENYWVDPIFSPAAPPGAATGVNANPGNTSAFVTWNAPTTGGPATSYVVTPYVNGVAQAPTTVTGLPAPTSATVTGLTNGTFYTFTVTASNPNGTGAESAPSNAAMPSAGIIAFQQQTVAHATNVSSLAVTPPQNVIANNRLIVTAGIWSGGGATASTVTDTAGDTFTELVHFKASDGTETSVWTAPITKSGGTKPVITVKATGSADIGVAASEYSGLAPDASILDKSAQATGTTSASATVSSGATAATTAGNELALGVYVDSGFGSTLSAGSGYTARSNISNASDLDILTEDQVLPTAGATPNASAKTGANTPWAMATLVLRAGAAGPPTAPAAPTGVSATAGNGTATVSWTAPTDGGSAITSYTITPYIGSTAQTATTITGNPPSTSATITGLTNGTTYTFKVNAANGVGTGPDSTASNVVTPAAPTAPGAPTGVSGTPGNGTATVSWTAPSNGGSPIISYTVTPYIGSTAQTITTVTAPATSTTISGLTNGTTYTFTVAATNAIGTGPASAQSAGVTPIGPTAPAAPTGVTATAGNATASVSWTAPANGGSAITGYTITPYIGSTAQPATTINGTPPGTSTTITGLTNGTAYTFKVKATNAIGTGPDSAASNAVTPTAPTVPAAPTGVSAVPGNGSATVSWTAPSNGGSAVTSYTVTPFIGTTAQTPVTVSGSPPATSTTVLGLSNGVAYTFTVAASNAIGAGPASSPSAPVTPTTVGPPTFVQQVNGRATATTVALTPAASISAGNRLVVLVGIWSSANATAKSITDAAGNTYTEVLHFKASDQTEMSVWTAPITAGAGTKPKITVTGTAKADIGATALEYSGLSTAAGAAVVDQTAQKSGTSTGAATVNSGATLATTAAGELGIGFYVDSGFGATLTAGSGFTSRTNVSNVGDMEMLVEDQPEALGATPNAGVGTGANTIWLMSTIVFKHG